MLFFVFANFLKHVCFQCLLTMSEVSRMQRRIIRKEYVEFTPGEVFRLFYNLIGLR